MIIDVLLINEDRLSLALRIKWPAFEVSDDLIDGDPGHSVRVFSNRGGLGPSADRMECFRGAIHTAC